LYKHFTSLPLSVHWRSRETRALWFKRVTRVGWGHSRNRTAAGDKNLTLMRPHPTGHSSARSPSVVRQVPGENQERSPREERGRSPLRGSEALFLWRIISRSTREQTARNAGTHAGFRSVVNWPANIRWRRFNAMSTQQRRANLIGPCRSIPNSSRPAPATVFGRWPP